MRKSFLFFFISSVVALLTAYCAQYIFNLSPCKLCLYERVPYFFILIMAPILIRSRNGWLFILMCTPYLLNAAISLYHVGLENGVFSDMLGCTETASINEDNLTFDDLKNHLLQQNNIVSCSHVEFLFLGLSMASWNIVYSIVCPLIGFFLEKSYVKS